MNLKAQATEIVRAIAPQLLRTLVGVAVFVGAIVLVTESNMLGQGGTVVFFIVAMVGPLIALGVLLGKPAQLVATADGGRFGGGSVVPWNEIAAIRIHADRDHLVGSDQLPKPPADVEKVTAPFFSYRSRQLIRSPRPAIYFTFARFWTRYRLPIRMAWMKTHLTASRSRESWKAATWAERLDARSSSIDFVAYIDVAPQALRDLVAQLEAMRARTADLPVAYVATA